MTRTLGDGAACLKGRTIRARERSRLTLCLLAAVVGLLGCTPRAVAPAPTAPRYVFSWPFIDTAGLAPRGGTSHGEPVSLAATPAAPWTALQADGLTDVERDRAAILAMAGDFRTSFDFLETVVFAPPYTPARPYRSWGTERVYVIEDRGDFIALQHILVMFVTDDAGQRQGPFVQKHWRQDWQYEPRTVFEYLGHRRWRRRTLAANTRQGRWSQSVYQVDDTPRYASLGRWQHAPSFSSWTSDRTDRPLPRREHTVRKDYDLLRSVNRHTVLPSGWVHEQDNLKQAQAETSHAAAATKAREIGVNRYERIREFDFSAGDAYWRATQPLWTEVRRAWDERIEAESTLRIATTCDDSPVFMELFRYAQRFEGDDPPLADDTRAFVRQLLECIIS